MKILLVEDCQSVAEVIFDYFEASGISLDYAATGTLGLSLAQSQKFDCIVLDIMLPGLDGISLCKQLRAEGNNTPIIMLTARDTDSDMLSGFREGADDYIVKPFNLELLEARIHSLIRRNSGIGFINQLTYGFITLDINTHQVWRGKSELKLTPIGFKILKLLVQRSPNVVSRQEIEDVLWPDDPPDQDILRKHVYQLRSKVDTPFTENIIETVPKLGYRLAAQ
ncbi:response regulator transcription factor [Colwellia sp. Arc7-635]|uniref:response regulator transcription factor n=1 Tax=Colwellia sp. Arc7-635 TaxID=2497879 RepID=UPI000F859BDE|nr:response regulator transcription factor [Colwellia sp. Arc7-635]AZQ84270.1 response regulator transcription factor [Colwellia sp. Arc7-635]